MFLVHSQLCYLIQQRYLYSLSAGVFSGLSSEGRENFTAESLLRRSDLFNSPGCVASRMMGARQLLEPGIFWIGWNVPFVFYSPNVWRLSKGKWLLHPLWICRFWKHIDEDPGRQRCCFWCAGESVSRSTLLREGRRTRHCQLVRYRKDGCCLEGDSYMFKMSVTTITCF